MHKDAEGFFEEREDGIWYTIDDIYGMEDFFLTLPSSGDIWAFMWSRGGITAGRRDSSAAIWPYYTDDKLSDMKSVSGPFTAIKVGDRIWKPLDPNARARASISTRIDLSAISWCERNSQLGLTFTLTWMTAEKHGLVKKIEIRADRPVSFSLIDGARNLMPAGATEQLQSTSSTLLDAYRKTEADPDSGLVALSLSSIITDRAEPNEALSANVSYFTAEGRITLSPTADLDFEEDRLDFSTESLGERACCFLYKELDLKGGEAYSHMQVFDVDYSSSRFAALRSHLLAADRKDVEAEINADVEASRKALVGFIAESDGIQNTGDLMSDAHHEASTLFNIMRGGTFTGSLVPVSDFKDFVTKRNRAMASSMSLPEGETATMDELEKAFVKDEQTRRLFYEYIPLTFSRRHGDPSRPWNRFSIKVADDEGRPILNYEGNWRDIFQNWEALCLSWPGCLDHMISRFLDTMTVDGYNPYRINRDGFEWEEPEPDNPWAAIGYWNDHQVVYLTRLLQLSGRLGGRSLASDLSTRRFSSANVPYRLKSYAEIEENPHNTIIFDRELSNKLKKAAATEGSDAKLVQNGSGSAELVSLATKLLQILVSKLCNLVPGGGIWMNTQRPEWNDANNALAGYGLSIVSTAAVRGLVDFMLTLLRGSSDESVRLSPIVLSAFEAMCAVFANAPHGDSPIERLRFVRENGLVFEAERTQLYARGFTEEEASIPAQVLIGELSLLLEELDWTLRHSLRDDGLYHSYNVMHISAEGLNVLPMKLQLEGQVALLQSGLLDAKQATALMKAMAKSALYEPVTGGYLLYPDRKLPSFWQKNTIEKLDPSFQSLSLKSGKPVFERDVDGRWHFNSALRNVDCLRRELGTSNAALEALYEDVFHHRFFTGRSDSFFRYEGLGSIYWHMDSKLLLSLAEIIERTPEGKDRKDLFAQYRKLRSALGYKRSAASYGSFPFIPYSHTPKGKGAKQPGMTGQVKEDIIIRFIELGLSYADGCVCFAPTMLEAALFRKDGSLSFTLCGRPVVYHRSGDEGIGISVNGGKVEKRNRLTKDESAALFSRDASISTIDVYIGESFIVKE